MPWLCPGMFQALATPLCASDTYMRGDRFESVTLKKEARITASSPMKRKGALESMEDTLQRHEQLDRQLSGCSFMPIHFYLQQNFA